MDHFWPAFLGNSNNSGGSDNSSDSSDSANLSHSCYYQDPLASFATGDNSVSFFGTQFLFWRAVSIFFWRDCGGPPPSDSQSFIRHGFMAGLTCRDLVVIVMENISQGKI